MKNNTSIQPLVQELPSHYADRLGQAYASSMNQDHKKRNGQFFTPIEIAAFMASQARTQEKTIRILDPGCGSAILSCALVEHLIQCNSGLKAIDLTAYEIDSELAPVTERVLGYLKKWAKGMGVDLEYVLHKEDFVLHNAHCFQDNNDLFSEPVELYDIIISNPPYFKLPIEDQRAKAARIIVNGHPNIYSIFMALAAKLLKENGELVFITPRSYASGGYFKAFREFFFRLIQLEKVHLFVSRKDTFSRDKVLQETVIIKGTRKKNHDQLYPVLVSTSGGIRDLNNPVIRSFPQKNIIDLDSKEKILNLPTTEFEESVLNIFNNWSGNLSKYGIRISTGPVVAFRASEYIKEHNAQGEQFAPLFWLHNVKQMALEWPVEKPQKGQYISVEKKSRPLLVLNKNCILLRRFSSKDDKNRLVAAPYFDDFIQSEFIGIENKLNYIYRIDRPFERDEVVGLCALLNSELFDTYFRIFNGNVNVSATELRAMPLPPLEIIKEIGDTIILANDFSVISCNAIVKECLELERVVYE